MKDSWVDPGPNMIRDGRGRGKTPEFPGRVGERVTTRTEDWWCDHPLTDGSYHESPPGTHPSPRPAVHGPTPTPFRPEYRPPTGSHSPSQRRTPRSVRVSRHPSVPTELSSYPLTVEPKPVERDRGSPSLEPPHSDLRPPRSLSSRLRCPSSRRSSVSGHSGWVHQTNRRK